MSIGALPILFGMMKVGRGLLQLRMPSAMAVRVTGSTQNLTGVRRAIPVCGREVPRIWATSEYLSGEEFL
jgi:hypothetical protein